MIRSIGLLAAFTMLAAATGCVQQPVASAVIGPTPAGLTAAEAARRALSPVLLRRARDHAYRPRSFFCRGPKPDWTTCLDHDEPGYSQVLFFCQVLPVTGSSFLGMQCIDADNLSTQLQLEEGAHDESFNFAN